MEMSSNQASDQTSDKKFYPTTNKEYNKVVQGKQVYAITVTFKLLHRSTPLGQFWETAPYLCKLLERSTDFVIVPEWRITNGSIHYHGVVKIKDTIKWLKQTLPRIKSMGFILIKPCDDKEGISEKWKQYYTKDIDIARGVLPPYLSLPISYVPAKDIIKIDQIDSDKISTNID